MKPFNPKEAAQDLEILNNPVHGGGMNMCYGDGYYANSLINKWGMSISEIAKRCKDHTMEIKINDLVKQIKSLNKKELALFNKKLKGK